MGIIISIPKGTENDIKNMEDLIDKTQVPHLFVTKHKIEVHRIGHVVIVVMTGAPQEEQERVKEYLKKLDGIDHVVVVDKDIDLFTI